MRFLRLKRPSRIEAVRTGANEEEDEEGRQGLLPSTCKHEQSSAHLHCNDTNMKGYAVEASKAMQGSLPSVPFSVPSSSIKQSEQESACTSQMVVLKANLHCQGCARRVKKTLSKLQGVQTYHVDMEQQKVTVIGNVCPDNVLQSVNKVIKGAQLWAAPNKPPTTSEEPAY